MGTAATESQLVQRALRGFRADAHVRLRLPGGGLLNMDRKLPFLFVYRQPDGRDDAGTPQLIAGESSFLLARGAAPADVNTVVHALSAAGTAELGSFLVLELWAGPEDSRSFVVHAPHHEAQSTVQALCDGLRDLGTTPLQTDVVLRTGDERHPTDLPPLLEVQHCWETGCLLLGLEVPPLFRAADGTVFPVFLRRMRGLLSPVLRQAAFEFARVQTTSGFESYRALGPRRFGDEVFDVDRELADIERSFDMLLLVSPVNSAEAWRAFRDRGFDREPDFHYRLLPFDPDLLKRRLYALELERIADPAMAFLLRDKREELDREITMLGERNTADFLLGSMRLYGRIDDMLLNVARGLLQQVREGDDEPGVDRVSADDFARLARAEIEHYRTAMPDISADVQVRPDLIGLLVSRGNLLIGDGLALRPGRVEALLHHEVGTHVLTWFNGSAQPLRQLCTGLAGYDELQEGLAVLSEYLAGGLDRTRLRVLAARVLAVHSVEDGADFMETFRLLTREHGFYAGTAFDIAERVHSAGGFTRDGIYLRGLIRLVEYLRADGELEPLYIGKLAARHVDIIGELAERGFLAPAPLVPRVLGLPDAARRLQALRDGLPLTNMVCNP